MQSREANEFLLYYFTAHFQFEKLVEKIEKSIIEQKEFYEFVKSQMEKVDFPT